MTSLLLSTCRSNPNECGISNGLYFANIYPLLCSCGFNISVLQKEIEERKKEKETYQVLNDMGIIKMCCRKTILTSPVFFLVSADRGATIDDYGVDKNVGPFIQNGPSPVNNIPFPKIPWYKEEDTKPIVLPKINPAPAPRPMFSQVIHITPLPSSKGPKIRELK